jgi:SAM-dependent methyltransferase
MMARHTPKLAPRILRVSVIDRKATLKRLPGMRAVSSVRSAFRAHWFDWRHHVKTCGDDDLRQVTVVGENVSHAIAYIPTTPRAGRHILRNLPVTDVSSYTFIDIGSGKGRMLLLAAELPFRRVIGIEFASDLHALAQRNVKTYRNSNQACFQIEPVHMDATQYEFPLEPLLIYLFYPFDQVVMGPVMQNLDRSLAEHPRDVILVYHNPVLSGVVESASHLKVCSHHTYFASRYAIYRSIASSV